MPAPADPARAPRRELLGLPLDPVTMERAVEEAVGAARGDGFLQHGCLNAAKVVRAHREPALADALRRCGLVTADGQAIVWAARLLGRPLPGRVAGIDLMEQLLEAAERTGLSVYLLGAREEPLARAAAAIRARHPRLEVAGTRNGYWSPGEEGEVVRAVAASGADLLFVALDTPRKELFLERHREEIGVGFAMGVGGAFDVLAGDLRRAPAWARGAGLEWLFRLAQEPRRLARRYVAGNTQFAWLVLRELMRSGRVEAPSPEPASRSRTILAVGPGARARGGVAGAIRGQLALDLPGYRLEPLPTFLGETPLGKAAAFAAGLVRGIVRIPSDDVAAVHLHASSWWSFRRKLAFHALARLAGKPVVWQIHCSRFERFCREAGALERAVLGRALRDAAAVLCLSTAAAGELRLRFGIEPQVLPHPVPADPLPRADELLVTALGDVTEAKGAYVLLDAFAAVRRAVPAARLTLAGKGDLDGVARHARALGLAHEVELPGWLGDRDRVALLARTAVVVQPSFAEALPMAVLEAMAAGRAVVASRVGGIPDVIADGETGVLVPPGDAEALARALTGLLADRARRDRIARAAAQAASAFSPGTVAEALAGLYDRVTGADLADRGPGPRRTAVASGTAPERP